MKKFFMSILVVVFICVGAISANALTLDPDAGLELSKFQWTDGLGQIDAIQKDGPYGLYYDSYDTSWDITVDVDSLITIEAYDNYIVGDEFALYVDGIMTEWTETWEESVNSPWFHGEYEDLFLTAGSHTFTLYVTELASGYICGGAYVDFSTTTDVGPAPVPEPCTMLLMGTGLMSIGFLRRKFKKA